MNTIDGLINNNVQMTAIAASDLFAVGQQFNACVVMMNLLQNHRDQLTKAQIERFELTISVSLFDHERENAQRVINERYVSTILNRALNRAVGS